MSLLGNPSRLVVHQVACEIAVDAVTLARMLRGPGAYERGDQLVGAAVSIPSNIAEACGRATVAEFRRFLAYARGSAQEVLTQVRVIRRTDAQHVAVVDRLEGRVILVLKMIGRLSENPPPER